MDLLDFSFRIEKSFGFKISRHDYDLLPLNRDPADVTVGEFHQWVIRLCLDRGMQVPFSSWTRVKIEMARTTGKPLKSVHQHTLVKRDLGFC